MGAATDAVQPLIVQSVASGHGSVLGTWHIACIWKSRVSRRVLRRVAMQQAPVTRLLAVGASLLLGLVTLRAGSVQADVLARPVDQTQRNAWASLQDASG